MVFERNVASRRNELIIRSLTNNDLSFYKKWYMDNHFNINKAASILNLAVINSVNEKTISEDDLETLIMIESKENYIFIVERNDKPIGEIIIGNKHPNKSIELDFKHAYHQFEFQFYEDIEDLVFTRIMELFSEEILNNI